MWTILSNCSKQLTVNDKVREKDGNSHKIYVVAEVEFDQYKLTLLEKNGIPVSDEVSIMLPCEALIKYRFEVE